MDSGDELLGSADRLLSEHQSFLRPCVTFESTYTNLEESSLTFDISSKCRSADWWLSPVRVLTCLLQNAWLQHQIRYSGGLQKSQIFIDKNWTPNSKGSCGNDKTFSCMNLMSVPFECVNERPTNGRSRRRSGVLRRNTEQCRRIAPLLEGKQTDLESLFVEDESHFLHSDE
jgi:hypothetical protein